MTPTECPSDCVLPDDESILRLDVRQLQLLQHRDGELVGPLGLFGRLVLPTFCLWTFNKFVGGNVVGLQPRFERSAADCADRVTRVRYQELLFSASVLGAAIALNNCRHPRNMRPEPPVFQPGTLS